MSIIYDILKTIFDEIDISLKYEDLYDAKTRLKELFDMYPDLGKIKYKEQKIDLINYSTVYQLTKNGQMKPLGKGSAALKQDAQQNAAQNALIGLNRKGFVKPVPEIYKTYCK